MDKPKIETLNESILWLAQSVIDHYWAPLHKYLTGNPKLIQTFPGFLLQFEQVIFYLGKTHLGIEYVGPNNVFELKNERVSEFSVRDYSLEEKDFFDLIVGFEYKSTALDSRLSLPNYSDDWILPTNKGFDKLIELGWNFSAQNALVGINSPGFELPKDQFCRLVNARFYDADESGLKTRYIKWIDFIPLYYDDSNPGHDVFRINFGMLTQFVEHDARYRYPLPSKDDYKYYKLPIINRFIELIGTKNSSETQITSFLEKEDHKFILTMGFFSKNILPQLICEWQSEDERPAIQPDFFVLRPNGYADILEFKLPSTKSATVVGRGNRETFSAEMNSYISQTRVYRQYFEDPNNRTWVEETHGIKVRYPRRIIVIGRRWHFPSEDWKEIANDFKDIELMTYDDLVDGVIAQFYM